MRPGGHWIVTWTGTRGEVFTAHEPTLAEAWRWHKAAEPIITKCPAPGDEECHDCWQADVPF